jgi:hypothetical protein
VVCPEALGFTLSFSITYIYERKEEKKTQSIGGVEQV